MCAPVARWGRVGCEWRHVKLSGSTSYPCLFYHETEVVYRLESATLYSRHIHTLHVALSTLAALAPWPVSQLELRVLARPLLRADIWGCVYLLYLMVFCG